MSVSLIAQPNRSALLKIGVDVSAFLFQFDASISERYSRTKEVTQHPVESGADISDHTRILPREIDIRGWVSDNPIVILASVRAQPAVRGGSQTTRALDAWRELNRIMDEESIVTVVTSLDEFQSMVLTNIDVTREKDGGRILDATISLREVITATTEVAAVPTPARPAGAAGPSNRAPKGQNGKQVGKEPSTSGIIQIGKAIGIVGG